MILVNFKTDTDKLKSSVGVKEKSDTENAEKQVVIHGHNIKVRLTRELSSNRRIGYLVFTLDLTERLMRDQRPGTEITKRPKEV